MSFARFLLRLAILAGSLLLFTLACGFDWWLKPIKPGIMQLVITALGVTAVALIILWYRRPLRHKVLIKSKAGRILIGIPILIWCLMICGYDYNHPNRPFSSYWGRYEMANDGPLYFFSDGILKHSTTVWQQEGNGLFLKMVEGDAPAACHPTRLHFIEAKSQLLILGCERQYTFDKVSRAFADSPAPAPSDAAGDDVGPMAAAFVVPFLPLIWFADATEEARQPMDDYTGPLQ